MSKRLTTDEILKLYPSMDFTGKYHDTVQGRFYGDLPYGTGDPLKIELCEDNILNNIHAVDNFIVNIYKPAEVYKFGFCHGDGYMYKHDEKWIFIAGSLTVKYDGRTYNLSCFNNHCGINGWEIWVGISGKPAIEAYQSPGYDMMLPSKVVIPLVKDNIEKVLRKIETDDEYGFFAKEMIKVIRRMEDDL